MGRTFHSRVSLVTPSGDHVRYLPGPLAAAMVHTGSASITPALTGKVRSITLTPTHGLVRIGEPTEGGATGVRFHRWVRLDGSATRVVEHHPRCTYE